MCQSDPDNVGNRISNGSEWRHDGGFSNAANAIGVIRIRYFENLRVDEREIRANRHSVIQEAGRVGGHYSVDSCLAEVVGKPVADICHGVYVKVQFGFVN